MENYILSLIKENNRVIIPEFGAFIVAKENGISVLFNNFLSFNDGLLVDHLVNEESISKEEANTRVVDYVAKLKEALDAVGSYTIEGLGKFTKDATGILRFEQAKEISAPLPSTNATPIDDEDLLDIDSDDNKDELSNEEPLEKNELPSTTLNDTTPIAEVEEDKGKADEQAIPALQVEEEEEDDEEEEEAEEQKPEPTRVANKYIEEDNKKRNRSITLFLVLFILVPLIGFGVYQLFFKGDSPAETQSKIALEQEVQKEIKEELPTQDMGEIDAGPDTTEKEVEVIEPVIEKPNLSKPHFLIVGSFGSEPNASRMITKLKAKGYDQCITLMHNNRYLVSLESFEKVYQAQTRQEEILQSDRMESWIMTKRK